MYLYYEVNGPKMVDSGMTQVGNFKLFQDLDFAEQTKLDMIEEYTSPSFGYVITDGYGFIDKEVMIEDPDDEDWYFTVGLTEVMVSNDDNIF
jgi:hypothetical protein